MVFGLAVRCDQPLGEVGLQCRGHRGHSALPNLAPRRAAASCISSGDADRYQ